jgi:metal transporter CNNM
VLLTLLSDSVFAGVGAFAFSTVVITFFGEIIPQAYFSRNALRIAAAWASVAMAYRILLFPLAWTSAFLLDRWLGPEAMALFRERDFRTLIRKHVEAAESDLGRAEGAGALNFLDIDDIMDD